MKTILEELEADLATTPDSPEYQYCEICGARLTDPQSIVLGVGPCCRRKTGAITKEIALESQFNRPVDEIWKDAKKTDKPTIKSIPWVLEPNLGDYPGVDIKGSERSGETYKVRKDGRIVRRFYNSGTKKVSYYAYSPKSKIAKGRLDAYNDSLEQGKKARIMIYRSHISTSEPKIKTEKVYAGPKRLPADKTWFKMSEEKRMKWLQDRMNQFEASNSPDSMGSEWTARDVFDSQLTAGENWENAKKMLSGSDTLDPAYY